MTFLGGNLIKHLVCIFTLLQLSSAEPEVTVVQGKLQGKTYITENGFSYDAYMGIPYAKPPLGDLRFMDPQPPESWEGIRNVGKEWNVTCPQVNNFFDEPFTGAEDCLYLNVYVPQNTSSNFNLPVMFWIHGGGFFSGSGIKDLYGPDYLVEKNVIIVSINYRLGPLGFLCLHSAEVPGNAGMKDQVLALQWVKENIKQFGGDPKQVTIFGESAGSASVHYLMLSPMANGLFSQGILESGTSFNEWAFQHNPLKIAFTFGKLLGFNSDNKADFLKFLKSVPVETLIELSISETLMNNNITSFTPVREEFSYANSFLTEYPKDILMKGKYNVVPTMCGSTSNEGALVSAFFKSDLNTMPLKILVPNIEAFIPNDLLPKLNTEKKKQVANKLKEFYFKTEDNHVKRVFDLWTDYAFLKDIDNSTKVFAQHEPNTYYYKFSYSGSQHVMKKLSTVAYEGASHLDELGYLFKFPKSIINSTPTESDKKIIGLMTELWTNFAKFGNPSPHLSENIKVIWKPVTGDEVNCLDINEKSTIIQDPYQEKTKFWQDLYSL